MVRIGKPTYRFPPASHYHAWPRVRISWFDLDGGCQMHRARYWANHTARMIDQLNQLTQRCFATQIDHPPKRWMVMPFFTDLRKHQFSAEVIHDRLPPAEMPPFHGEIELSSTHNN